MKHAVVKLDQPPESEYLGTILSLHGTHEKAESAEDELGEDPNTTITLVGDYLKIGDLAQNPTAKNYDPRTDIDLKLPPK